MNTAIVNARQRPKPVWGKEASERDHFTNVAIRGRDIRPNSDNDRKDANILE